MGNFGRKNLIETAERRGFQWFSARYPNRCSSVAGVDLRTANFVPKKIEYKIDRYVIPDNMGRGRVDPINRY
jgi:hypothetical protein